MRNRGEVLRTHYVRVIKRIATWAGLAAITATAFVAGPAGAVGVQITPRTTTLSSTAPGATTVDYAFSFKLPSNGVTIKAVMIQICDSPLETTTCTVATGASLNNSATLSAQGGQFAGWAIGAGIPPSPTANTLYLFSASGFSENSATGQTLTISHVTNPSATNAEFYTRITTYQNYNGSGGTTEQDYGAMAVSTADQVIVNANVQESLTFCVYLSTCGGGGGTLFLAPAPDHVLSASAMTGGVSKMDASTNAGSGYVITYMTGNTGGTAYNCSGVTGASSGSLGSPADCIPDAGGSAVGPPAVGTGLFGINLKANSATLTPSGALGANVTGTGTGAPSAPYATADQVAFQAGATPRTIASAGGPTVSNTFTVTYAAQAGSTNKPGVYATTFTYVCTGTF